jgi:gluconate 2-dehydrogenase gamma chain
MSNDYMSGVRRMSRRAFLRAALVSTVGAVLASACDLAAQEQPTPMPTPAAAVRQAPSVGSFPDGLPAPQVQPVPGRLRFFNQHQADTVEAFTARLLPGTPDDPGAREAGVVTYIDNVLAYDDGFWESVYREGPWPELYEGDEPPGPDTDQVIWVAADEIERYGYQSPLTPREVYEFGLAALDAYANDEYGDDFVDLSEDEQDEIIEAMAEGEEDMGFEPFSAESFFHVLRRHTKEGMFCDPMYGGNRDMVGWRLVGWPGAQRAYTPTEVVTEGIEREPWSMNDLPHFNYSRPREGAPLAPAAPARGPRPAPGTEIERGGSGHSH